MNSFAYLLRQQIFFYDKSNNFFTFILFMLSSLDRYTKPQTFADCVGDELPLGWEESFDQIIGRYYINHFDREFHFTNHFFPSSYTNTMHSLSLNNHHVYLSFWLESTQLEDPRQEWKSIQEQMLHEYLTSAQDVLVAKKEIYDVKNRRLRLAEDEYNLLTKMAASRSSCKWWRTSLEKNGNKLLKSWSLFFPPQYIHRVVQ